MNFFQTASVDQSLAKHLSIQFQAVVRIPQPISLDSNILSKPVVPLVRRTEITTQSKSTHKMSTTVDLATLKPATIPHDLLRSQPDRFINSIGTGEMQIPDDSSCEARS